MGWWWWCAGGKPFIEKDGSFYCEKDYYNAFK
jgi:hypothetical protein